MKNILKLLNVLLIVIFCTFNYRGFVFASPYGCGSYGSGAYQSNTCAGSNPSSSPASSSTKKTSAASTTKSSNSSTTSTSPSAPSPASASTDSGEPQVSVGPVSVPAGKVTIASKKLPVTGVQIIALLGVALVVAAMVWIIWYKRRHRNITPAPPPLEGPPVTTPTVWG
jgi:hypothetical protein